MYASMYVCMHECMYESGVQTLLLREYIMVGLSQEANTHRSPWCVKMLKVIGCVPSEMYVCMYVCMYVYVCECICMYVCMYVCMKVNLPTIELWLSQKWRRQRILHVRACVCLYVCMYVCMYMNVYISNSLPSTHFRFSDKINSRKLDLSTA